MRKQQRRLDQTEHSEKSKGSGKFQYTESGRVEAEGEDLANAYTI